MKIYILLKSKIKRYLAMTNNEADETQQHTSEIEVLYTEAFSQHDKAIYEAGKTMLVDSIKNRARFLSIHDNY